MASFNLQAVFGNSIFTSAVVCRGGHPDKSREDMARQGQISKAVSKMQRYAQGLSGCQLPHRKGQPRKSSSSIGKNKHNVCMQLPMILWCCADSAKCQPLAKNEMKIEGNEK